MSVAKNARGIVNGHWEPSEPRASSRLAVACLGGAELLKKAALNAVVRVAPARRASKALVPYRGAW
jgi:hypothetical protein